VILAKDFPPEVAACQLAFEVASIAAGIVTLDGHPVWFSSAFPALLGYSPEEFSGHTASQSIHPEDVPAFQKRLSDITNKHPSLNVAERRYRHKNGHYFWVSVTSNMIRNEKGEATHILGIFQDISERKRQEHALQESKDQLNTVLESVKDVVWSYSTLQNKQTYINSNAAKAIYQREAEEFYANPDLWMEVVHPDDRARVGGIRQRLGEGPTEDFYRIVRPSGEIRWIHALAWATLGEDGKPLRYEGILRDVTELKESEQLIETQRAKLAAAAKMSALGEMAGGLAHEINNPVAIIHGNAVLLEQFAASGRISPTSIREAAETIAKTSERISKIVRSLLTFAREVTDDPFQTVPVKDVLAETEGLCRLRFDKSGISFQIEPSEESLTLECRPVQITQVLLNLMNNAYDAVKDSPNPWIRISVLEDKDHLLIQITDSGSGIPVSLRERIFQPFFTTKEIGKGTGLGLSVSNGIAEMHGGTLRLDDSYPNTRFILRLPRRHRG